MKTPSRRKSYVRRDANFSKEILPNFWVMDDHRWAFFGWEASARKLKKLLRYSLIHIDYHYDGCDVEPEDRDLIVELRDLRKIKALLRTSNSIRNDSFIVAAIARKLLCNVHFYCTEDHSDPGIFAPILTNFECKQHIHKSLEDLLRANVSSPLIFDLCLDFFNKSDQWAEGDLWSDQEIIAFLDKISTYAKRADIVTVSYSFNYSGTEEDTRHLEEIVLPRMLEYRKIACK